MTCAPTCTETDVLAGLAQLSDQLHNLSGFLFVASVFVALLLVGILVVLFVNGRVQAR